MRRTASFLVTVCLAIPAAAGEQVLLPVFALGFGGRDGNLWSAEVYLTNAGPDPVTVDPPLLLPGRVDTPTPCLPPAEQLVVPPGSTVLWSADRLAFALGCPALAVGALLISADGPVRIQARVVNVAAAQAGTLAPLQGFGQEVPGIPLAELLAQPERLLLPALVWDPLACGPVRFDTYLGLANPFDGPAEVTVDVAGHEGPMRIRLGGAEVDLPATVSVPARSWRQLHVGPAGPWPAVCGDPQTFDLVLVPSAPVAAYGSVVDRSTQDPRTVLPVPAGG